LALVKLNWNKANDKYSLVLQHSICYLKYKTKNASLNMLLQYVENKLVPYSIIVRKKGRKEIITYDNYSFLIKDLQQNFILNVEYQKLLHNFYQGKLQNKLLLNLYDSLQKNLPANSLQQLLLN
jgi:ABC-type tungstate transport system permease subunit